MPSNCNAVAQACEALAKKRKAHATRTEPLVVEASQDSDNTQQLVHHTSDEHDIAETVEIQHSVKDDAQDFYDAVVAMQEVEIVYEPMLG